MHASMCGSPTKEHLAGKQPASKNTGPLRELSVSSLHKGQKCCMYKDTCIDTAKVGNVANIGVGQTKNA